MLDRIRSAIEDSKLANTNVRYSVVDVGGVPGVRIDRSASVRGTNVDTTSGKPVITLNANGREQVVVGDESVAGLRADQVFIDLAKGCCLVSQARRIVREALALS